PRDTPRSCLGPRPALAGHVLARAAALRRADPPHHAAWSGAAAAPCRHGGRDFAGATAVARHVGAPRGHAAQPRSRRAAVPFRLPRLHRMSAPAADIVVIGSGPAGVSAALPLVEAGRRVVMIDGGRDTDAPAGAPWRRMLGAHLEALRPDDGL